MCGIVGYIGSKDIESVLLVGLERLSYRGYDSSGIATIEKGELSHWKRAGKIHQLTKALKPLNIKADLGIGHTRWATHGQPTQVNAHPQISQNKKIALVHNGIIENYMSLQRKLIKEGAIFHSETDSEVIIHLVERYHQDSLAEAVEKAVLDIVGTYAIAVVSETNPDRIVACRKGSPLIIGLGKNENYISSDINTIIPHTKDVIYLDDNEIAIITRKKVVIKKVGGVEITKKIQHITWDATTSEKEGYAHYMLKEIFEQPAVIRNILSKYLDKKNTISLKNVDINNKTFAHISRFIIQACGTSWHAGLIGKYLLERYARVLTEVDISSEFRYKQMIGDGNEIVIAISQSGETADTIACIREAKSKFFKVLSFVNVKGSTIDHESDGVIYSHSGQEIGVASTKNFIAQLVTLYVFALHIGHIRWTTSKKESMDIINGLKRLPEYVEKILSQAKKIEKIAEKYYKSREFIFIGRGINFPSALEGALKLKEISYIHATGYPAGELKHGPIALIDENLPVVCISPKCGTYDKMISNIQEVRARKGQTIVIATEGDKAIGHHSNDIIYIPEVPEDLTPILVAVPLQLLAYYIAVKLNCDVDQPRNLAKSVTVE